MSRWASKSGDHRHFLTSSLGIQGTYLDVFFPEICESNRWFYSIFADVSCFTSTVKQGPSLWLIRSMARLIELPFYRLNPFIGKRLLDVFPPKRLCISNTFLVMVTPSLSKHQVGNLSIAHTSLYIRKMVQAQTQKYFLENQFRWKFRKNERIQVAWRPEKPITGKDILSPIHHIMTNSDDKFRDKQLPIVCTIPSWALTKNM